MAREKCLAVILAALASLRAQAGELRIIVSDVNQQPLADAVVFLEPANPAPAPAIAGTAQIDQVNKMFVPAVTVIRTGTSVEFPNSDNIRHSVYSFSPAKIFTTKLYAGKAAQPVIFDKPGIAVLGCNIHDSMIAWVVVVDTPYYAKSDSDGLAVISSAAAGDYHLRTWHQHLNGEPASEAIHVGAESLRKTVSINAKPGPPGATNN